MRLKVLPTSPFVSLVRSLSAILLSAWSSSGASAWAVTELPKLIQSGIPVKDLSGGGGEGEVFRFLVPEGAKEIFFQSTGGTGDCDLFVRRGVHPTSGDFDGSSESGGTREAVTISAPEGGVWYLLVQGFGFYRGVTISARITNAPVTEPVVKFSPGPGTYAGGTSVQMIATMRGATIRYTTDGTEPTEGSPRYRSPVKLAASTDLRARAWLRASLTPGPISQADYAVQPQETVTQLVNGLAVTHRAGLRAKAAFFKLIVPPGQGRLDIVTQGGTGDSDIAVRLGELPEKIAKYRANRRRNVAQLSVKNPAAGEWFIRLRARSTFQDCSLVASYASQKADLVPWAPTLEPYLNTETFEATDCAVVEGMITAGRHRLLRFSTESRNIGGADLVMPPVHDAAGNLNPIYEFQECHGHYHFLGFAAYRLLSQSGATVATGRKVSFCLEDVEPWSATAPRESKYDCDAQGIQAGWSDIYDSGLEGQWIDVTTVAPGIYTLEVTLDPDNLLEESDNTNNSVHVPVVITPQ